MGTNTAAGNRRPPKASEAMCEDATEVMRLLEFTDSAFPVGTFSFSNGLETAAETGLVHDASTLEAYVWDIARQAAFTDGITALHALRSYLAGDYSGVLEADRQTLLCKMNDEVRLMSRRMGRKLAELAGRIRRDAVMEMWLSDIVSGLTPGTYPVGQGILFAACGIGERPLFASHQYGVMNMVLSAALRCVRVSHYDTQRILFELSERTEELFGQVREADFEDMQTFVPQADILASMHEKGTKRLFMN